MSQFKNIIINGNDGDIKDAYFRSQNKYISTVELNVGQYSNNNNFSLCEELALELAKYDSDKAINLILDDPYSALTKDIFNNLTSLIIRTQSDNDLPTIDTIYWNVTDDADRQIITDKLFRLIRYRDAGFSVNHKDISYTLGEKSEDFTQYALTLNN